MLNLTHVSAPALNNSQTGHSPSYLSAFTVLHFAPTNLATIMTPDDADEEGLGLEAYDPTQHITERRQIARALRLLEKELATETEALLKPDNDRLAEIISEVNDIQTHIKQTSESAIDSKVLYAATELNNRRLQRQTAGSVGNGIDVDELVSKAITYMRRAAGIADDDDDELTHTQRNRRRPAAHRNARSDDDDSDDEDGAGGDMMNWPHLGRFAAIPHVRRPALPGFLLGPLSVQKKARRLVVRTAPLRIRDMHEVRPEVLRAEDIEKNEAGDLTAICSNVFKVLKQAQASAHARLQKLVEDDAMDQQDVEEEMERLGIAASGHIDMVRFCINPKSFGQTVENLFYVSFLIRDSHVHVVIEENGLPSLGKPLCCSDC